MRNRLFFMFYFVCFWAETYCNFVRLYYFWLWFFQTFMCQNRAIELLYIYVHYKKFIKGKKTVNKSIRFFTNVFLAKCQLSIFLCLLFAEEIYFLLVNKQKKIAAKTGFWKVEKNVNKISLEKIFIDHKILVIWMWHF